MQWVLITLGHWLDRADTAPDDRVRYKRAGTRSRPDLLLLLLFFAPQLRTRARRGPVSYRTHRRMNGESPGDPSRDRAPCGKSSDIRGVSCRTPVGKTDTANRRPLESGTKKGMLSQYPDKLFRLEKSRFCIVKTCSTSGRNSKIWMSR